MDDLGCRRARNLKFNGNLWVLIFVKGFRLNLGFKISLDDAVLGMNGFLFLFSKILRNYKNFTFA